MPKTIVDQDIECRQMIPDGIKDLALELFSYWK